MNPWLRVFAPFAAGYYLSYLLRNVNAVIAPDLTRELGVSATDLGLLTSAYLLAFGAFQLPLGLLLDRYGPRRVEAALLLVAAAGCAAFALARDPMALVFARGMIGLGVSACLMASFKAFSLWFPAERQPSLNAAVMAAGGLGALTATIPVSWALPAIGWRGVFLGLAVLVVSAAALILTTPDRESGHEPESLKAQLHSLLGIVGHPQFRRFAPQTLAVTGGFMAVQGLWAVPWLTHFNGFDRDAAAFHLLLTSSAMLIGFLAVATLVVPLRRRGIEPETVLTIGMGGGLLATLLIVTGVGATHVLWFCLGLSFSVGNLAYALLCAHFPLRLSGRVNTALNLGTFIGAFSLQWGFGVMVDTFQAGGLPIREAYRWSYGGLLILQVASFAWFVVAGRRNASKA